MGASLLVDDEPNTHGVFSRPTCAAISIKSYKQTAGRSAADPYRERFRVVIHDQMMRTSAIPLHLSSLFTGLPSIELVAESVWRRLSLLDEAI